MTDSRPGEHWRLVPGDDGGEDRGSAAAPFTADAEDGRVPDSATPGGHGSSPMQDKDVQRLEDRIAATEDRGQLRLELAMTKIDGKLDAIVQSIQEVSRFSNAQAAESAVRYSELRTAVSAQATESAVRYSELRTAVSAQAAESAARDSELRSEIRNTVSAQATETAARHRDLQNTVGTQATESATRYRDLQNESAARYRELRNTVIVTGLAVVFGIVATLIGLKQVWIGGVEVGLPLGQAIDMQPAKGSGPTAAPAAAPPGQATSPAAQPQRLPPPSSPAPSAAKPND